MSLFLFSNNDTKATQIEKQSGQDLNPVLLYSKVQANVLQDALMQIVVLMPQGQRISIWRSHLILACKKLYVCMLSCSFMSDSSQPHGCSPPGSSDHGISQATILEWVSISYFRGSSRSRDGIPISCVFYIGRQFSSTAPPRKPYFTTHTGK